ncbi:MAG: hypothetical protein KDA80_01280 [Planctomycetaceae bacterium]|nr:hypothetical protein [Planctomycetaceae bacterium]
MSARAHQFSDFLDRLFLDGRLCIESEEPFGRRQLDQALPTLLQLERDYRLALPGTPPEVRPASAIWGMAITYWAAQRLAYRHLSVELPRELEANTLDSDSAGDCYSVDLTFRFLPDLLRLSRSAKCEELTLQLMAFANDWPLSSVGIEGLEPQTPIGVLSYPSLRTLYVDRIIARQDVSRLSDEDVREAVRAAIGIHSHLAPQLVEHLQEKEPQT